MAQLPDVFNAAEEEPMQDFSAIPAGWYTAQITGSEMKENSKGTGSFLNLKFTILEGDYAKRNIFTNLNIVHTNEVAVQIARRELKSICDSIGLESVEDSNELHGTPIDIKVAIRPATEKYAEGNEIKAYRAVGGSDSGSSDPFGIK